jgi:hypothetical protein
MNTEMCKEPLLELEGSSNDRDQDNNPPNSPSAIFEMEPISENTVFGNSNAVSLRTNAVTTEHVRETSMPFNQFVTGIKLAAADLSLAFDVPSTRHVAMSGSAFDKDDHFMSC